MSKRQALLETLLGAAELNGNRLISDHIRHDLFKIIDAQETDGYERLARAAAQPCDRQRKAA